MGSEARFYRWDEMPKETLTPYLDRRFLHGEQTMLAHVYLKKDCFVPQHHHSNEQVSYILEGAVLFKLGANGETEQLVKAGEVLVIPSNLPHSATALEDSLSLDVFCPPRQDWIEGNDAYLREQK